MHAGLRARKGLNVRRFDRYKVGSVGNLLDLSVNKRHDWTSKYAQMNKWNCLLLKCVWARIYILPGRWPVARGRSDLCNVIICGCRRESHWVRQEVAGDGSSGLRTVWVRRVKASPRTAPPPPCRASRYYIHTRRSMRMARSNPKSDNVDSG